MEPMVAATSRLLAVEGTIAVVQVGQDKFVAEDRPRWHFLDKAPWLQLEFSCSIKHSSMPFSRPFMNDAFAITFANTGKDLLILVTSKPFCTATVKRSN